MFHHLNQLTTQRKSRNFQGVDSEFCLLLTSLMHILKIEDIKIHQFYKVTCCRNPLKHNLISGIGFTIIP